MRGGIELTSSFLTLVLPHTAVEVVLYRGAGDCRRRLRTK